VCWLLCLWLSPLHCCVNACLFVLDDTSPNVERSSGVGASDQPPDTSDSCKLGTIEPDADKHCQNCDHLQNEVSTGYLFVKPVIVVGR